MRKCLLFFFCFFCLHTYAQRTLIPYRIADKWGVTNFYNELVDFWYKFHFLAYGILVESGEIPNPFKK